MKGLVLCDPLSKFTEEALRAQAQKFACFPELELEYVTDTNHMRMANPKEYNLRMEKEGPEGWITPDPEFMEKIGDADILFTSFCGVTEEMLKAGKNLKRAPAGRTATWPPPTGWASPCATPPPGWRSRWRT